MNVTKRIAAYSYNGGIDGGRVIDHSLTQIVAGDEESGLRPVSLEQTRYTVSYVRCP